MITKCCVVCIQYIHFLGRYGKKTSSKTLKIAYSNINYSKIVSYEGTHTGGFKMLSYCKREAERQQF